MNDLSWRPLKVETRYISGNQSYAIRDVYDALTELITNSDDSYSRMEKDGHAVRDGIIEIELSKKKNERLLRVRDYAEGMNSNKMRTALGTYGNFESGLEIGYEVRGTNSRGAKDIASIGSLEFLSITKDNEFTKFKIRDQDCYGPEELPLNEESRTQTGIKEGSGTLVIIDLKKQNTLNKFEKLREKLSHSVALSEILSSPNRKIILTDIVSNKTEELARPKFDSNERINEPFEVTGYPGVKAKLRVYRRKDGAFSDSEKDFRLGMIRITDGKAVHESSFLNRDLENDPLSKVFFGKLECKYIKDLHVAFDKAREAKTEPPVNNFVDILDPSRRSGLTRKHPFVEALASDLLNRLKPLIEEERKAKRRERQRLSDESTEKDLQDVGALCSEFMASEVELQDNIHDDSAKKTPGKYTSSGISLIPPVAKFIVGEQKQFSIKIDTRKRHDFFTGDPVDIKCDSESLVIRNDNNKLSIDQPDSNFLSCYFNCFAVSPVESADVSVAVQSFSDSIRVKVFPTLADQYSHIQELQLNSAVYRVKKDKKKQVQVFLPMDYFSEDMTVSISVDSNSFKANKSEIALTAHPEKGIAQGKFFVHTNSTDSNIKAALTVEIPSISEKATAALRIHSDLSFSINPKLVDEDFYNQRTHWSGNVLEIAGRHPTIKRYLGSPDENFPGQHDNQFRVLLAEIVTESVCARILETTEETASSEDWDVTAYIAKMSKLTTKLAPMVHNILLPDTDLEISHSTLD